MLLLLLHDLIDVQSPPDCWGVSGYRKSPSLPHRSPNHPDTSEKYINIFHTYLSRFWFFFFFHASKTKQPYLLTVAFINSKFTYTISYVTDRESQVVTSTQLGGLFQHSNDKFDGLWKRKAIILNILKAKYTLIFIVKLYKNVYQRVPCIKCYSLFHLNINQSFRNSENYEQCAIISVLKKRPYKNCYIRLISMNEWVEAIYLLKSK